ncbi:MAG: SH3 domain-containing protein [Chloroflexi bacterium]|nr:SH3 domain-containing protein [Chloroflexota bacterium]
MRPSTPSPTVRRAAAILISALLLGVFAFVATRQTAVAQDTYTVPATVTAGALNVRNGPSIGSARLAVIFQGAEVTVIARNDTTTWVQIQANGIPTGWVGAGNLDYQDFTNPLPVTATTVPFGFINTGLANFRTGPGFEFGIIGTLPLGTAIDLLGRSPGSGWLYVRTEGQVGWVGSATVNTTLPLGALPIVDPGPLPTPSAPTAIPATIFPTPTATFTATPIPPTPVDPTASPVPGTPVPTNTPGGPILPTPTVVLEPGSARITTGALNVRTGPGIQFSVIRLVFLGDVVEVIGRNSDFSWAFIETTDDGTQGWVSTFYIEFIIPPPDDLPILP